MISSFPNLPLYLLVFMGLSETPHSLYIQRSPSSSARRMYHGPTWGNEGAILGQCGRGFQITRGNGQKLGMVGKRTPRIIGGFPVESPIPWQVSIEKEDSPGQWRHICGGSLISEYHVLTASHCINSWDSYRVTLGKNKLHSSSPYEQTYEIRQSNIVTHRRYGAVAEYANDIAILRIEQPNGDGAKLNDHVYPICIPSYSNWESKMMEPNSGDCIVSGFGSTNSSLPNAGSSILHATAVPIHSQDRCSQLYNSQRIHDDKAPISGSDDFSFLQNNRLRTIRFNDNPRGFGGSIQFIDEMLCAGSLTGTNDHCFGDSGGPLACKHRGRYYLVGLVSWGSDCGELNKPGLYTRVSHFLNWIENEKLLLGP